MSLTETVAGNVRAEIARYQVPKALVAEAIGCSRRVLAAKLAGRQSFDVADLDAIATLLRVDIAELLVDPHAGGPEDPDDPPSLPAAAVA